MKTFNQIWMAVVAFVILAGFVLPAMISDNGDIWVVTGFLAIFLIAYFCSKAAYQHISHKENNK